MVRRILLIILLIVSLGYALYTYWPKAEKPVATVPQPTPKIEAEPTTVAEIGTPKAKIAVPTPELKEIKLVDPFALRVSVKKKVEKEVKLAPAEEAKEVVKPAEPKLEGIWVDSEMKVAFISGQALGVGGTIMGWKVTSISKERVVLQKGSATKILKLEEK